MSESDYESEYEQETAPRVTVTTVEKKKQTSQAKLDQLKKARLAKVAKREERLKNPPKHAKRAQAKPEPEAPPSESETETVYVKKQKAPKIVARKKKKVVYVRRATARATKPKASPKCDMSREPDANRTKMQNTTTNRRRTSSISRMSTISNRSGHPTASQTAT
jgi:hypothetical protein